MILPVQLGYLPHSVLSLVLVQPIKNALIVPCHRVVPKSGGVGGYRWGGTRKQALLDLEKQLSIINDS